MLTGERWWRKYRVGGGSRGGRGHQHKGQWQWRLISTPTPKKMSKKKEEENNIVDSIARWSKLGKEYSQGLR